MIGQVLDERRLPSLTGDLAIAHCRYSTTGSTIWENAQPTLRLGPRRALAIGHNGNLVNTRELLDQLDGGRGRLPATHRHGAADRAPRRRARRRHGRRPAAGPAARPRRVQPRDPRRAAGHRRPRPARVPAARPRPPADAREPPTAPRACGTTARARLGPRLGDRRPRHRRRRVRARRGAGRDRRPRGRPRAASPCATPRRRPRCACSSSSTSPGPTRTWRAATCTRPGARWGCSWRRSTRSTRTS